jgi:hypothetical protein
VTVMMHPDKAAEEAKGADKQSDRKVGGVSVGGRDGQWDNRTMSQ